MEKRSTTVQRALATKLTFEFHDDMFVYTLKDLTGEVQFSPRYETINIQQPYSLTIKDKPLIRIWRRAALGISAAVLVLGVTHNALATPAAIFCAVFGAALLVVGSRGVKCTMLKMNPPPPGAGTRDIRIMRDANHDQILQQIKTRWRNRLRFLYLSVNRANESAKEIAKYKFLLENDVISEPEYQAALREIRPQEIPHPETRPLFN